MSPGLAPIRRLAGCRLPCAGPAVSPPPITVWLLWALLLAGQAMAAAEFPGPRISQLPAPGLSVLATRLPGDATDELLVGMADGSLGLIRYIPTSVSFEQRQRLVVGGRVVGLMPWHGLPLSQQGVVVATADPDRVLFLRLWDAFPFLRPEASVDLDEDPGTMAWFGDLNGGRGQVAVSLPGIDAIAILTDDGGWRVSQTVAVGDEPLSLAGADLDGDGIREVIAAQRGVLSGDLAVLSLGPEGQAIARFIQVPGLTVGLVASYDAEGDGVTELAVTDRDLPRVAFLRVQGPDLVETDDVALTVPALDLTMWTLPDGSPALLAGNTDRGAAELVSLGAGGWGRRDTYYPGCRPLVLAPAEVDGDGLIDIATVGSVNNVLALMLAKPGPAFWGLPALALTALPGDFAHADFDGDGRADVLVAAAFEPRLSLFAGTAAGGLATTARNLSMGFSPGKFVAIEVDGDPVPELAALDVIAGQVVILDGVAQGGPVELARRDVGAFPTFLTAGDIDADGKADLLALPSDGSRVQLLFGEGGGAFSAAVTLTYEIATTRAALADLNGDGRLDVIGVDGISRVWWRVNLDGRTFGPGQWLNAGAGASALAVGDLDGDGDQDLVVACRIDQSLVSFENLGNGNLVRRTGSYVLDSEPAGVRIGDFDSDGRGDVVVNLRDADRLDIYLSLVPWNHLYALSVPTTPEVLEFGVTDVNGDGRDDLLALDNVLRMGVAHLNLDPSGVALEPRSLVLDCRQDGGLDVRLEPGMDGPWRLLAHVDGAWRPLADAAGTLVGRLDAESGVWRLTLDADDLVGWGRPTALRLEVTRPDGDTESSQAALRRPAPRRGSPEPRSGWPVPGRTRAIPSSVRASACRWTRTRRSSFTTCRDDAWSSWPMGIWRPGITN